MSRHGLLLTQKIDTSSPALGDVNSQPATEIRRELSVYFIVQRPSHSLVQLYDGLWISTCCRILASAATGFISSIAGTSLDVHGRSYHTMSRENEWERYLGSGPQKYIKPGIENGVYFFDRFLHFISSVHTFAVYPCMSRSNEGEDGN
jgi:hypothetical protein